MSTDETGLQDESRGDIQKKIICWPSPGCIHKCGLTATVRDGRLVPLSGKPDYPTPNKGCADRMPHHAKWLYSSEQLLHPLKRKGERGENQWEQISWEVHPDTARELGIEEGDWVYVETRRGVIRQRATSATRSTRGWSTCRVTGGSPSKPAASPGSTGSGSRTPTCSPCADDPDTFDPVTGGWPLRALLCKVYKE